MIKINVITRDKSWKKYILKPNLYLNKKAKILEKKISIFKKKNFSLCKKKYGHGILSVNLSLFKSFAEFLL